MARASFIVTIPNWEKHNGSKKKNHRYILLETRFFEDAKITQLKQIDVLLFIKCLTIAGDLLSNRFEVHAGMMPKRWRIDDKSLLNCLNSLQEIQLLTYEKNDSLLIQKKRKQKNTKEENRKESAPAEAADLPVIDECAIFVEYWNTLPFGLAKVSKLTDDRRKKLQTRLQEASLEDWKAAMERIGQSSFLRGKKTEWKADFDWFIANEQNRIKIIEGKYDNSTADVVEFKKTNKAQTIHDQLQDQFDRVARGEL